MPVPYPNRVVEAGRMPQTLKPTERAQLLAAVVGDLVRAHGGIHTQLILQSVASWGEALQGSAEWAWSSMTSVSGQAAGGQRHVERDDDAVLGRRRCGDAVRPGRGRRR